MKVFFSSLVESIIIRGESTVWTVKSVIFGSICSILQEEPKKILVQVKPNTTLLTVQTVCAYLDKYFAIHSTMQKRIFKFTVITLCLEQQSNVKNTVKNCKLYYSYSTVLCTFLKCVPYLQCRLLNFPECR